MKKLLSFALLLFSGACFAQSFEGTITWSVKTALTDPAKQAEMDKAQKTMSDPATQAKIKQMQEAMDKPEMKAMMDANPQMKAQMESRMKMMQGGGSGDNAMVSAMPNSYIIETKGNSVLTKSGGGMTAGFEMLYDGDKKQSYSINRTAKTYTVYSASNTGNAAAGAARPESAPPKVTKTNETMKILGYNCTKYIVEITTPKGTMTENFWTSTEVKGMDMRNLAKQRMGNTGTSMYYEGLAGVPLRIEMNMPEMKMAMEVTDIKKGPLPAEDFTIPADFQESKRFGQ